MTPEDLKANAARFNGGSERAQEALGRLQDFQATHRLNSELRSILEAYIAAVQEMLESSAELVAPALEIASKAQ